MKFKNPNNNQKKNKKEKKKHNTEKFKKNRNKNKYKAKTQKFENSPKTNKPGRFATGPISVTAKGFGFVIPEEGFDEDIFIPKKYMKGAADGDLVKVRLADTFTAKGPEGRIVSILKREHSTVVGTIIAQEPNYYLAFVPLLGKSKPAKVDSNEKLKVGDRIVIKIINWREENAPLEGVLAEKLGHINDAAVDTKVSIAEFNLKDAFSKEALAETASFNDQKIEAELKSRQDYTDLNTITIDPATAKDFDDALSLTKDKKGHFHLGVHIADVAFFVPPASSLDQEALQRANSTYFPGFCLPMLPKELSNGLCSLKPDVLRLVVSVMMEFDGKGDLLDYKIKRSVIKNKNRFSYEDAFAVIEGKKPSPFAHQLKEMVELCLILKKQRSERGSIEFALPSTELIIDDKGEPQEIKIVEYDISHQMVEEFMLKANEIVAEHLKKQGKMLIYRVHESPDSDAFEGFFDLAKSLGFSLPPNPGHTDIQKLFLEAKDSPLIHQLSVSFIRSMNLALYSPENLGHYGLALEHYCHFTSPIRRYSDLIIERLLFNEEGEVDLNDISKKCSLAERKSFKAEVSVINLKKLRLLKKMKEKNPTQVYEATVTKIKPYNIFFEVKDFYFEGSLHLSELNDDFYIYNSDSDELVGDRTGRTFAYGDKIKVSIQKINLPFLEVQWKLH